MTQILIDQEAFEIADFIGLLALQGEKDIAELARRFVSMKKLCEQQNVFPNRSDINKALSTWREDCGFEDSAEFGSWVREYGVSENALKIFSLSIAMEEALLQNIDDDEIVKRHNEEVELESLRDIYGILIESKKEAAELARTLKETPAQFFDAARQHSFEAVSRVQCGYLGRMAKEDLPQSLAETLFAIDEGEIVGPVDFDDCFIICTAYHVSETTFTDDDASEILEEILEDMIAKEAYKHVVQRPYLEK